MNHLDKLFGNPVQRIDAIIAQLSQEPIIVKLKCELISDLFRVKYQLAVIDSRHYHDVKTNAPATFDEYYELSLEALEIKLSRLSARLNAYTREQVAKNNRAEWNKEDNDIWR